MADRILTYKDIETITLSQLLESEFVVTNYGLSEELIKELSADISSDAVIELIRIQDADGNWLKYSNDPTDFIGTKEDGTPIYTTAWNGEEWMYYPFESTLNSVKASGEIVAGGISILNQDPKVAEVVDRTRKAIPIKHYIISKNTGQCILKNEHMFLTATINNGVSIQATPTPADVLGNPCPAASYNASDYRGN